MGIDEGPITMDYKSYRIYAYCRRCFNEPTEDKIDFCEDCKKKDAMKTIKTI